MTADQSYLRPTLRAHLYSALAANQRFAEGVLRLAEFGKVYLPRPSDLPDERELVCAVVSGPSLPKWWKGGGEAADFYFAKGVAQGIFKALNLEVRFEAGTDSGLDPSDQAEMIVQDIKAGVLGEIHSKVRQAFDISGPAYLIEVDLAALLPLAGREQDVSACTSVPRSPA